MEIVTTGVEESGCAVNWTTSTFQEAPKSRFCLATANGSIPLAAVKLGNNDDDQKNAEFELDTQNGDSVPNVIVGDKLDARKGANSGKADCGAPLLISARFHR
jgi:hypothetical protein